MGKTWDGGDVAFQPATWDAVLNVLKPGAHLMAFGGTRTSHRLACAIEDAGFELRDTIMWLYGCLSDDTEILVNGQWEQYHKAIEGSLALGYNISTNEFSWQPIQQHFEYQISDTAYRIESDSTDQIVSRNHRCLVEQDGAQIFQFAEEAARECEIRVPVLEDMSGLLRDLPVPGSVSSTAQGDVFKRLRDKPDERAETTHAQAISGTVGEINGVRGVRGKNMEVSVTPEAYEDACVLLSVQRRSARPGMGEARAQGAGSVESGSGTISLAEDDRPAQPSMEGRCDLLPQTRQLRTDQIRQVRRNFFRWRGRMVM